MQRLIQKGTRIPAVFLRQELLPTGIAGGDAVCVQGW